MKILLILLPLLLSACGKLDPIEAGEQAIEAKDWPVAIAKYSFALSLTSEPRVVAFALARRGHARVASGDIVGALEDLNACLKVDPSLTDALIDRSECYDRAGERGKAIEDCSRAIALKPTSALARVRRGIYFGRLQKYEDSVADFTEALRLEPENLAALIGRSRAFEKKGDVPAAIADLETARRIRPEYEPAEKHLNTLRGRMRENGRVSNAPQPTSESVTRRANDSTSK
jgi:tetratricopeptide (TPR) repeat protein